MFINIIPYIIINLIDPFYICNIFLVVVAYFYLYQFEFMISHHKNSDYEKHARSFEQLTPRILTK